MTTYADLEIGLHRRDADSYSVEVRYSQPESDAEIRLVQDPPPLQFDMERLRATAHNAEAYGQLLSKNLFVDTDLQRIFSQAFNHAQSQDIPLRLRLGIGPSAPELHRICWETLRNPQDGSSLLTSEYLLFSRYLSSFDWQPVRLRPQAGLRALVMIANPADLSNYEPREMPLAPIDVTDELLRAQAGLGSIPVTTLASEGSATLDNLNTYLRDDYDILYLVCHGAQVRGESWLWLEDETGNTHRVAGSELVTRLRELRQRPRLVVLASCQSAGSGIEARTNDAGALAALGPRLAEAGIPAVLAMQGDITIETVVQFMPVFFRELQRDGQIDRAMAVARGAVRGRPDWWMPVLFMRLKSGRIWYAPGFAKDQEKLEKWPALLSNIRKGRCTPILGPSVTEALLGNHREIAKRWAEAYHFPMAPHAREDLPQVAQYLAISQEIMFPRDLLIEHLRQEMLKRYSSVLPDTMRSASLDTLITEACKERRPGNPAEPYYLLAELPLSVYITTNPSSLLVEALKSVGKEPQVELCRWNDEIEFPSIYDVNSAFRPTEQQPLVYYLFGHLHYPASLVLTEDDYFDYLIGVTSNKALIPEVVRRALVDTALLFLGFQLDDWNFRVLFRSIMSREGQKMRYRYTHVAAQITPEEGRLLEPERARRFLERSFQDARISIYWGGAEDFLQDLSQRWKEDQRWKEGRL